MTYKRSKELTNEELETIFATAIEGGINYWGCVLNDRKEWQDLTACVSMNAKHLVCDLKKAIYFENVEDEAEHYKLTFSMLMRGVDQFCKERGDLKNMIKDGVFDAIEADCLFQYAIFGEILFS